MRCDAAAAAEAAHTGVDRRAMWVLAIAHACVDGCQAAVPAMLPFMVASHELSFTAAGALVLAATVSSTIVQPVFGTFSDRTSAPWLLPAGVVVACLGVAAAGVAPSYGLALAAIVVSGLGVAAFHPEGSRFANYVSGARRATGMSYYSLGGNVGFALGPVLITPMLLLFDLPGALVFVPVAALLGWLLRAELPRLLAFRPRTDSAGRPTSNADDESWPRFVQLMIVICARSFAFYSLLALVPLYFIDALDSSDATANAALTAMLVLGALGTVVGGRLADRFGRRPVLVASLALQPPLLLGIAATGDPVTATVLVGLLGFVAISSFSVTVVMGQEFLPTRIGLASGFTLGAAIGLGGVAAPVFGLIGEELGLSASLQLLAVLPAAGALLALALPTPATTRRNLAAARDSRATLAGEG